MGLRTSLYVKAENCQNGFRVLHTHHFGTSQCTHTKACFHAQFVHMSVLDFRFLGTVVIHQYLSLYLISE
jgi:hypothetical protein